MTVVEWVADNREWMFSGMGLGVFSAFGRVLWRSKRQGEGTGVPMRDSSVHRVRVRTSGDVTISTGDSKSTAMNYLASEGSELRYVNGAILSPESASPSGHHVALTGRCSRLPPEVGLWLMTQEANSSDLFHPDDGPLPEKDGRWMGRASIGNRQIGAHSGKVFKIHLVAATEETGNNYKEYLAKAHRDDAWLGISSLMGGRIIATIELRRDDEAILGD